MVSKNVGPASCPCATFAHFLWQLENPITFMCCALTKSDLPLPPRSVEKQAIRLYASFWVWISIQTDQMSSLVFTDGVSLFLWIDSKLSMKTVLLYHQYVFFFYIFCIFCVCISVFNQLSSYFRVPCKTVSSLTAKHSNSSISFLCLLTLVYKYRCWCSASLFGTLFQLPVLSTLCLMVFILFQILNLRTENSCVKHET